MKKQLLLLVLMLCSIGIARAEDVTIFKADVVATKAVSFNAESTTEISSEMATINGGKMCAINEQTSAKNLIALSNNVGFFCITNNNTYFKIELENALQVGDVITSKGIGGTKDSNTKGIWVTSANQRPKDAPSCVGESTSTSVVDLLNYKVKSDDDLVGKKEIYIYRQAGATQYFDEFTITRSANLTETSLSFSSETANATLGKTFTAPTLTVSPVAAASEVVYSSSKPAVATVDKNGNVTLVGGGKTVITAEIANSITYTSAKASYTLTVTDPNVTEVTATWPFNTGAEGQKATINVENVFSVDAVNVADMTYVGVGADQGITGTKMQPVSQAKDDKSQFVKFTLTPKKGITFKPTSVSFDAMRWGTDGDPKLHYYVEAGSSSVDLGNVNPNRNGKGEGWSHYEHEISNVEVTKDNPFALALYVYGLATTKQISFANIVVTGTFEGTAEDETMYAITTSVNPEGAGSVSQNPAGESLSEGTAITFTAVANTGYQFLNKWLVNGTEVNGESYTVESLSGDLEVVAQFKKLYTVSFSAGEGDKGTTSHALPNEYVETVYTTPAKNYYVSKDGYTVTGWTDGAKEYGFAEEITLTGDITLSPIFEENTVSLSSDRTKNLKVTWDFTGTPVLNIEKATGYYVVQGVINGKAIDIPMYINNAEKGKANNASRTDDTQINENSTFTIPAVSGMTVVITAKSNNISTTTVGGEAPSSGSGTKTATYVYNGSDETVDIVFGNDGKYYTSIVVTYPANGVELTFGETDYATFYYSNSAYEIPDGVTAYVVENITKKKVGLSSLSGVIPAGCGVILERTDGEKTVMFKKSVVTADAPVNLLRGSDEAEMTTGELESGSYKFYALTSSEGVVGFYYMAEGGAAFTNGAHKAYLALPASETGTNFISLFETDGINQSVVSSAATDAPAYNLAGQRVGDNYRGVVIVNGMKHIRK